MIPGIEIALGGQTFTVAPMNMKTLQIVTPLLGSLRGIEGGGLTQENIQNIVTIIQLAINRNHPDVTFDFVNENMDLVNMGGLLEAAMKVSGLQKTGEAPAASA